MLRHSKRMSKRTAQTLISTALLLLSVTQVTQVTQTFRPLLLLLLFRQRNARQPALTITTTAEKGLEVGFSASHAENRSYRAIRRRRWLPMAFLVLRLQKARKKYEEIPSSPQSHHPRVVLQREVGRSAHLAGARGTGRERAAPARASSRAVRERSEYHRSSAPLLNQTEQLLALRGQTWQHLGMHRQMQIGERPHRPHEGPGLLHEVLHERRSSNPLEENALPSIHFNHARDGGNRQGDLGELLADLRLLVQP